MTPQQEPRDRAIQIEADLTHVKEIGPDYHEIKAERIEIIHQALIATHNAAVEKERMRCWMIADEFYCDQKEQIGMRYHQTNEFMMVAAYKIRDKIWSRGEPKPYPIEPGYEEGIAAGLEMAAKIAELWNGTSCAGHDENPCCHTRTANAIGERIRAQIEKVRKP